MLRLIARALTHPASKRKIDFRSEDKRIQKIPTLIFITNPIINFHFCLPKVLCASHFSKTSKNVPLQHENFPLAKEQMDSLDCGDTGNCCRALCFQQNHEPQRSLTIHTNPDAKQSQPSSAPLRIACYNIAHGRGVAKSNWEGGNRAEMSARLDQIAELLRRIDADVVVLNEVDFDSTWSYSVNQARILAEKSGYPFWIEQRNLDARILTWRWRFGNAIFSKHPITNAQIIDLPGFSKRETLLAGKKRAVICEINAGDKSFQIIGSHLSHRSEFLRVKSARMIVNIAAAS